MERVVPAAQRESVQLWLLKNYPATLEVPNAGPPEESGITEKGSCSEYHRSHPAF
jgi:hypothetical protein